jgi:hypothetical protein
MVFNADAMVLDEWSIITGHAPVTGQKRSRRWERKRPSTNPHFRRQDLNEPASGLPHVCSSLFANGDRRNEELSVNPVPDFVKQRQEWALRFRDSSHSRGEIRDRALRNARENQQNDMSLNPIVCLFRSGSGVTAI